jgi:hypothetical protein
LTKERYSREQNFPPSEDEHLDQFLGTANDVTDMGQKLVEVNKELLILQALNGNEKEILFRLLAPGSTEYCLLMLG